MEFSYQLANIKCAGCAATIKNNLENDNRISNIDIDVETGTVHIESETDASSEWLKIMADLGYPEKK